jgi:hypothetical protein
MHLEFDLERSFEVENEINIYSRVWAGLLVFSEQTE